jgi:hypothetical protein
MRNIIAILVALVLVAALAVPVAAAVTTNVNVSTGGGSIPIVKCKWEQEPITDLESGDPAHATLGTQINPPLVKGAKKQICYFAVVTDDEDGGAVSQAFADVYHPIGVPAPYNNNTDPRGALFKYEIPFTNMGHGEGAKSALYAADQAHLITYGSGHTYATVLEQLNKGTADLWSGCALIDYEQPCGDYDVNVYAVDNNNNLSEVLHNQFKYVCTAGIEVDFTGIVYGPVNLGIWKQVSGDVCPFVSPAALAGYGQTNLATVRNIGNTWVHVKVMQDDMTFGKDVTGAWNVQFAARMGNNDANKVVYSPGEWVTLPNYLGLSSQDELDFFIKIIKGFGAHNGTITLGSLAEPFTSPAPIINTCP